MTYQLIEIKKLDRSPSNVRKTDSHAALEELKASILAHGLMQNLVVVPAKKGKFQVIAGGRRLEALRQLQGEGKLPADHAVACQIAEGNAEELSLVENVVREAMHPADQYEAFAALIEKGLTAAQIATRFGVEEKLVLKRLKLGRVAPDILAAFRAEELSLESLMAFTVTDDRKRQVSVWKSLEGWQQDNPGQIRKRLTEQFAAASGRIATFVGLDTYKAAGGAVRADLFSEAVYLENPELLERLALEKLEAEAEKLRAEGWGWVEIENDDSVSPYSCRRIQPKPVDAPAGLQEELAQAQRDLQEVSDAYDQCDPDDEETFDELHAQQEAAQERVDEIEGKLAIFAAYDPEEMKTAGCLIAIDSDGELDIEKGRVKPEERTGDEAKPTAARADAAKPKPEFSQSLLSDLAAYRTQAAQVQIASHPEIAFDLLVFHVASETWNRGRIVRDGMDVHFRQSFIKPSVEPKNAATAKLEAIKEGLSLGWLDVEGEDEQFKAFRALSRDEKLAILAFCTATTLKPTLRDEQREFPTAYETALSLTGGSVAELWRPTKDNYLSRITRDQLLGIGREFGKEPWVNYRKDWKKASLADELHGYFAKSHNPDTTDAVRNWLPKGMAYLPAPEEQEPAKQKPVKKGKRQAA